ncbi:hypothetical protein CLOM_g16804 [Closterium sp. NIES-68]|nr:hypothetical protein CLOM_g16804 [Closterium sp. NIES-68]
MDIVTAFLNDVLEEETFMEQPEGYNDGSGRDVMLKLQDKFKCKTLGDVNYYLGLDIERDVEKRWMRVHQKKYLEALAANFGKSKGHVTTPLPSGFKCVKGPAEESVGEEERCRFHSWWAASCMRPFTQGRMQPLLSSSWLGLSNALMKSR